MILTKTAKVTVRNKDSGETLHLDGVALDFSAAREYEILLTGRSADTKVEINFSRFVQNLALQCVSYLPELAPQLPVSSIEDAYRLPMQFVKQMATQHLQKLLRELGCNGPDTLIDFLWYMEDDELTQACLKNLPQREGREIKEGLNDRQATPLSQASLEERLSGRAATYEVSYTITRLGDEGQIPHYSCPKCN